MFPKQISLILRMQARAAKTPVPSYWAVSSQDPKVPYLVDPRPPCSFQIFLDALWLWDGILPPKSLEPTYLNLTLCSEAKVNSSDSILLTLLASYAIWRLVQAFQPTLSPPVVDKSSPLSLRHAEVTLLSGRDLCKCPAQSQGFSDSSRWWSTWYCWVLWGMPQSCDTFNSHHLNEE